jgi:anaerobic magnesium-protoporphyrin IX monomethyl ester cyclase
MRISLIQPATPGTEGWCPPLGLAYLASTLERENHSVEILDLNAEPLPEAALLQRVSSADLIGFTSTMASQKEALRLAQLMDGAQVIFGGPQASARPEAYLDIPGSIVFQGEAEISLPQYLQRLVKGGDGLDTPGIIYKDSRDQVVRNPRAPLLTRIDDVGLPARHLLNMKAYTVRLAGRRATNMMSSRGCPFSCMFCYHDYLGKVYRARSAASVVQEMEMLHDQYGIEAILFYDDNFTLQRKRVEEICTIIGERGLDMQWRCYSRVNGIDETLLRTMKEAGCCEIVFGVESGNQRTLDLSCKGIKVEESLKALKMCREVGISTKSYLMIGFPWETLEDIGQTVEFVDQILPSQVHVVIVTPFPGTPLESMLRDQGIVVDENIDITGIAQPSFETQYFTRQDLIRYRDLAYEKIRASNVQHVLSYDWKQDPDWRKQFKRSSGD